MSSNSEREVLATPIVVVEAEAWPEAKATAEATLARKARAEERAQHAARWRAIVEAGGGEKWVTAELRAKGLFVDTDPSTLAEGDKASFKEKKRVEAAERRRLEKLAWQAYKATHVAHVGAGIFYADQNDEDAATREARTARAKANDLTALDSPDALATALGVTIPELRWLCFHREVEAQSHYKSWTIPKRDGSRRAITAPKGQLKKAQRWLLRNVVEKLPVHGAAHGFLAARSIATNAHVHAGARVIVKVDVKDFFPTVTFRRVKGLFRKGGLPENVATLCALLATEPPRELVEFRGKTLYVAKGQRACPQGAPTSPGITNALCLRLDRRLSGLARTFGCAYTRYADDLAFSFREQGNDAPIGMLLHGIHRVLKAEGFRVNPKKTVILRAGTSQRVTGLVVNAPNKEGVPTARVPREIVRKLKAAIHNREHGRGKGDETLAQLKGMAAYVHMTDPVRGRAFLDRIAALEARSAPHA
jgi:hypothetical protein